MGKYQFPDEMNVDATGDNMSLPEALTLVEPAQLLAVTNVVDVARNIAIINASEKKLSQLKTIKEEFDRFFKHREESLNKNIGFLKQNIQSWMDECALVSVPTPIGTASVVKRMSVIWPDDDVIVQFVKENCPNLLRTEVRETVVKKILKEYLVNNPTLSLEGYEENPMVTLQIRS
jgi:hypothetical protein